ncbi:MAG: Fic family protein [Meiothermus sp.]|nr:Fic family protein [Meiothermus sp.]
MIRFQLRLEPSPRLQSLIERCQLARQSILLTPLNPTLEQTLRFEASAASTHHSTAIEGNPITLDEVQRLLTGGFVPKARNAEAEVRNYKAALDWLRREWVVVSSPLGQKTILDLQKQVVDGLEAPTNVGKFRRQPVYVFDAASGGVVHEGDPYAEVPARVEALCTWLNKTRLSPEIHPVARAAVAHLELLRIHPFMDGNGRTARLLQTLLLYQTGWDVRGLYALEAFHNLQRSRYYTTISTCIAHQDWIGWAVYMAEGLAEVLEATARRVAEAQAQPAAVPSLPLNERQMAILSLLERPGAQITNQKVQAIFGVSAPTAARDLDRLARMGLVVRRGKGRGTYYVQG